MYYMEMWDSRHQQNPEMLEKRQAKSAFGLSFFYYKPVLNINKCKASDPTV